jgi:hypothetical protein
MTAIPMCIPWPFRTNFPNESEKSVTATVLLNVEVDVTGHCMVHEARLPRKSILYYLSITIEHPARSIWGARCIDGSGKVRVNLLFQSNNQLGVSKMATTGELRNCNWLTSAMLPATWGKKLW